MYRYDDNLDPPPGSERHDPLQRPADEVADSALAWLAEFAGSRFFAWIHFYDPHRPYDPPEPYRSVYRAQPYLGEIAFVDSQIGRILEFLETCGQLDRTIIVVIGDHGESLGDHGEPTHGLFIYQSVIHVPFILRAPLSILRGRRVTEPTRSVDVLPTILDTLGLPVPTGLDGVSLLPEMTDPRRHLALDAYAETAYPRSHFGWSDLHALRAGRFKLIAAPRPELYDLNADPNEQQNVYRDRPLITSSMEQRLAELQQVSSGSDLTPADSRRDSRSLRSALASLGYVSGSVGEGRQASGPTSLPDPKDKLDLYNLIARQRDDALGGRDARGRETSPGRQP